MGKNPQMQVQSRRSASGARQCLDLEMPAVSGALTDLRSALAVLPVPASALDDARLLVSELVANSMRHARLGPNDTIRVTAAVENGRLRVDVIDGGRGEATPVAGGSRPSPGAESGWGLYLVETLATRWGHDAGRYWFELEIGGSTSTR
ncbi:MAG TPA: ATP-binding protein [Actinomycetota bacterium]|jgi:anti-sigma regulatory factor (Ser/Thr protein kinase)